MVSTINRRSFLAGAAAGSAALMAAPWASYSASSKPNFVSFLVDDLGWRDLACYGSTFYETPNIDRLAREGVRFTDAYAACCVCSPTRASILTGKYPARLGITQWIGGNDGGVTYRRYLPLEEVTIPEALKSAGYATSHIGKWHLGGRAYYPEFQGFDENKGGCDWGQPKDGYFSPYNIPTLTNGPAGEYLTDRLASEAEKFIDNHAGIAPFFLNLWFYSVHTPLQAKQDIITRYTGKARSGGQNNAVYAAMIESTDQAVGRVLDKLKSKGIDGNTVVIFMSDNGGTMSATSNAPLRSGKGHPWEGGIREPMIIKWPGKTAPNTICSEPVTSTDFYPTMLEMAGIPLKPAQHIDGMSLVPLLTRSGSLNRDALYWHYPHEVDTREASGIIRAGDYKLIELYMSGKVELYNLKNDIGETQDLSQKLPDVRRDLQKRLANWKTSVGAKCSSKFQIGCGLSEAVREYRYRVVFENPAIASDGLLLSFFLASDMNVGFRMVDARGRQLAVLASRSFRKGHNRTYWDPGAPGLLAAAPVFIEMVCSEGVFCRNLVQGAGM